MRNSVAHPRTGSLTAGTPVGGKVFLSALLLVTLTSASSSLLPAAAPPPPPGSGGLAVLVETPDAASRMTRLVGAGSWRAVALAADAETVGQLRERLRRADVCGPAQAAQWSGGRLPFAENLVNLLVLPKPDAVARAELKRVLAPGGRVMVPAAAGDRLVWSKPRPTELDDWTHYLHAPNGNPVSTDTLVGPPEHYQWVGDPPWSRHHDHMASMSALVSEGGRLFYIIDEGSKASIQWPPKWNLVARDAFNGVVLWRRPIAEWHTHLWPLKSGPAHLPRRLVARDGRVYVTLGITAPVSELDGATGKTLREYAGTARTAELLVTADTLYCLVDPEADRDNTYLPRHTYVWDNTKAANADWAWRLEPRRILALDRAAGAIRWEHTAPIAPLTLAVQNDRLCYENGESVVCLDANTGEHRWTSEPVLSRAPINTSFGPRLILQRGAVLYSGGRNKMVALDPTNGRRLWSAPHPRSGHQSPQDLMVINGLVWCGATANGRDSGIYTGRGLLTGQVENQFKPDVDIYWFHQRCYPSKATVNYLLPSRTGIEFIDFRKQHWDVNHWVRGGCIYGIMPANGLVYAPPHDCACYLEAKLSGFSALAPQAAEPGVPAKPTSRLVKGPAYGQPPTGHRPDPERDWPTYRHDAARSGRAPVTITAELRTGWTVHLGGRLTSPVSANGRVFVAQVDRHALHARHAATGAPVWHFLAGGRIDSPPTLWRDRVLFGSADGWIYCLRAADGSLVWRFRAAPEERRMMARNQVESAWPVSGSVLVREGIVHAVAGRSMFLDGGMRLVRLDAATGRLLGETVLDDRDPVTGKDLHAYVEGTTMPVALPDILSCDGRFLYLRSQRFNLEGHRPDVANVPVTEQEGEGAHLFAPAGFLDDSWFHRSYWMYGRGAAGGWGGWPRAGRYAPSGRLLVVDGDTLYGFGRKPEYLAQSSVLEYQLFAAAKEPNQAAIQRVTRAETKMNQASPKRNSSVADWKHRTQFPLSDRTATEFRWRRENPPLLARAMVLAGDALLVAGPPDVADERAGLLEVDDPAYRADQARQEQAWEGAFGGRLLVVDAATGRSRAELRLPAPPVWDGMAAARGRVFVALRDGSLVALAGGGGELAAQ